MSGDGAGTASPLVPPTEWEFRRRWAGKHAPTIACLAALLVFGLIVGIGLATHWPPTANRPPLQLSTTLKPNGTVVSHATPAQSTLTDRALDIGMGLVLVVLFVVGAALLCGASTWIVIKRQYEISALGVKLGSNADLHAEDIEAAARDRIAQVEARVARIEQAARADMGDLVTQLDAIERWAISTSDWLEIRGPEFNNSLSGDDEQADEATDDTVKA